MGAMIGFLGKGMVGHEKRKRENLDVSDYIKINSSDIVIMEILNVNMTGWKKHKRQ